MNRRVLLVLAALTAAALVVAAVFFLRRRDRRPDEIIIHVPAGGRSAPRVEVEIAVPLERSLSGLAGLRMIRSESTPAGARVSCFFDPVGSDDDLGLARAHLVREKLETVRQALPEDVAAPVIWHVGLTRTLWILAREDLRSKLLSIPGVAGVDVCGAVAPDERTVIRVDLARATAMGVELWDVQKQIERLKGIGALVSAPQQRLPARVFEVDKAAAVAANISPADVSRVVKLVTGPVQDRSYDLETEPSGNAALDAVRVHGVALSRLVRVTLGLEPASIVRINHRRAIELAWEVEDDGSVLGRVKGALEGFRDVQTTLEDLSW